MIKAIEWCRVSTKEQAGDDRAGLQRQTEANIATARRHSLEIIDSIEVADVSGTAVGASPQMSKLLEYLKSRQVKAIIVADFDRLCRLDNYREIAFLQDIKETNTIIYTSDSIIDLNTSSGFLNGGLLSLMGGNDLNIIKNRMLAAKEIKRRLGKHPGNEKTLPLGIGYDRKAEKYCYMVDKIQPVKKAFELFHDGGIQNLSELERLTGIKHRTLANILRNEIYMGYRTYLSKRGNEIIKKADGTQGGRKKVKRALDDIIRVQVFNNPLIDEEVWNNVQEILNKKNKEYHKKRPSSGERFLYAGFLRCGVCGKIMYSTSGGKNHKKDYYCCSSKRTNNIKEAQNEKCDSSYIKKEILENNITSFVSEKLTDGAYLKKIIGKALSNEQIEQDAIERENMKTDIEKLNKKRGKCISLYLDDLINKDELDKRVAKLDEDINAIDIRLHNVDKSMSLKNRLNIEEMIPLLITSLSQFQYWSSFQKRDFLRSQIPEFSITKDGIDGAMLSFCKMGSRTGRDSLQRSA